MRDYIFFKPSAKPLNRETENDICFLFKENKLILLKDGEDYIFPKRKDLDGDLINTQYMGDYNR